MAAAWLCVVLLVLGVKESSAEFHEEVCSIIRENHGLIPPLLPTNFELKGERANHMTNASQYEEMYFDYTNSRAKYVFLMDGVEFHNIFDYQTLQVLEYYSTHPGSPLKQDPFALQCRATNMEDDISIMELYGFQNIEKPRMYTSNQVLRFGGQYSYAYNNTGVMPDRGVAVNIFSGCLYDKTADITMKSNYSFSGPKVAPAGGTLEQAVTGIDGLGLLSVPVTMHMSGVEGSKDDDDEDELFDQTISVSWFKGEPNFKYDTFQLPPWIYCENYRGRKDKPKFPDAFSTRIQISLFQLDPYGKLDFQETTSYVQIDYYLEKKLARRDYTPVKTVDTEIGSEFNSFAPIKTIYDFNEGLLYVTHKPTGKCYIRPISHGDFFESAKGGLFIKMGTPEEIFQMESDGMEYKGTAYSRDIECDVWSGKEVNEQYNVTFLKETYMSTNGWHEETEDAIKYGVPVQHSIITTDSSGKKARGVNMYSFLKFKAKPPRYLSFDVSNCIETQDHQHLAIELKLSADIRKVMFSYKFKFLETAQYFITDVSQVVTPLRVQSLQLRRLSSSDSRLFLLFVMVGKIKLKALVGQTGATLQEAIVNLQTFIDRGAFAIEFKYPSPLDERNTETVIIAAEPSSLYNLTSEGILKAPVKGYEKVESDEIDDQTDNKPTDETEQIVQGMTPGNLTLLAFAMLFIGVGIGIAVMYLYLRKFGSNMVEDKIEFSNRTPAEISMKVGSSTR